MDWLLHRATLDRTATANRGRASRSNRNRDSVASSHEPWGPPRHRTAATPLPSRLRSSLRCGARPSRVRRQAAHRAPNPVAWPHDSLRRSKKCVSRVTHMLPQGNTSVYPDAHWRCLAPSGRLRAGDLQAVSFDHEVEQTGRISTRPFDSMTVSRLGEPRSP